MDCFRCFRSSTDDTVLPPPVKPDPGTTVEEVPEGTSNGSSVPTKMLSGSQWVVGLDFGTTFSGFAYAKKSKPDEILVYYDWPTVVGERYCKTLTGIYYTRPANGKLECTSWGYPARTQYLKDQTNQGTASQGAYLSNFKLLLKKDPNDSSLPVSIPDGLTLNDVITEYLKKLGDIAAGEIRKHEGDQRFKTSSIQWCVTVPSIWDDSAKQQMKSCMVDAGLVDKKNVSTSESIAIVLEPEAASFHCYKLLQKEVRLRRGDKILVADIGGGTTDIVVQEWMGSPDSYKVRELTESSGGFCGGTHVDESFIRFISERIGCLDDYLKRKPSYKTKLLRDWEEIKCSFGHVMFTATDVKVFNLPPVLAKSWEADEKKRGMPTRSSYDDVELTKVDLEAIFDPVVKQILDLIAAQLLQTKDIEVMFVVGGFAGSPHLLSEIRNRFSREVTHIVSPPNPGSAVCQGAVALALNPDAVESRIAKKTYGVGTTMPFVAGIDPEDYATARDGPTDLWCKNRFSIYVTRGSRVEVNSCVTKPNFTPLVVGQKEIRFDLFSSTELSPRYTDGDKVTKEGGIVVKLPKNYSASNKPKTDLSMYFGRTSIELKAVAQFKADGDKSRVTRVELPVQYHL